MTKRDTTLHLVFTHQDGRDAVHTVNTDQATYYGENVAEAALKAGIGGRLLRRIHFKFHGEREGVNCVETAWHLHVWEGAEHGELSWVSVSPRWRRRGLATALVAQATQQAQLPLTSTRLTEADAHLSPLLTRAGFRQTDVWVTLAFDL